MQTLLVIIMQHSSEMSFVSNDKSTYSYFRIHFVLDRNDQS